MIRLSFILFFSIFTLSLSCRKSISKKHSVDQNTIQILNGLSQNMFPTGPSFGTSIKHDFLKLKWEENKLKTHSQLLEYAKSLLEIGNTTSAINELEFIKQNFSNQLSKKEAFKLNKLLGVCYLRQGEENNCINSINVDACLFPIPENGIYKFKTGSKIAINIFTELLTEEPNNFEIRWLLNIAYMTIGRWPHEMPKEHLLLMKNTDKRKSNGQFKNIATPLGLATLGLAGGVIMDDFNNDGFLDIVTSDMAVKEGQLKYFKNKGDGTFKDVTIEAGIEGQLGGLNIAQLDYNNDGFLDIFITRGAWLNINGKHPNSLLKNMGDGTFKDVTMEAGLFSMHPTQVVAFADINLDGWIDIFVGNETMLPTPSLKQKIKTFLGLNSKKEIHPNQLYLNKKDDTFEEIGEIVGISSLGCAKGATWLDYDNDSYPDLYISYFEGENVLYKNISSSSKIRFEKNKSASNLVLPINSFTTWTWDYNNDGWEDIFVAYYHPNSTEIIKEFSGINIDSAKYSGVYHNNQDGTFTNVAAKLNLGKSLEAMGGNFGDFNNDGNLDFYLGTGAPDFDKIFPNRLFLNYHSYFSENTFEANVGHLQKGHGIAIGDIDNDGDQDIYIVMGGAYLGDTYQNALFQNSGNDNNFIILKLEGTKSNKSAIGSRVCITISDGEGDKNLYRTVGSGGSFGSSSLQLEIGIGKAQIIKNLQITWIGSGLTHHYKNLQVNKKYKITEGSLPKEQPYSQLSF